MARLYFEEIDDDETENAADIEEAENIQYMNRKVIENIEYIEIEDLDDIDDVKETEEFGEEEYREYFAHYEERKRIRSERQQRMRKQRVLKRFLCLGVLCTVMSIIVIVRVSGRKKDREEEHNQLQTVENVEQTERNDLPLINGVQGDIPEGADSEPDAAGTKPDQAKPVYSFTSAPNITGIYSEEVISTHAILVDESTDTIVAAKGADERIYPASMTKVLTVLVAAEQITEEDLDDTFTMTLEITDYAYVNDCSAVGFLDGEKVTVRDLFYGTVLPSGGDAALGLAIYTAGSQEAFVEKMNAKLEELGLGDSAHFTNCIGLFDENHYCTVYDMAIIMKAAIQNELCREVLSAHTYTTKATAEHPEGITISNWFLRKIEDKDTGGEVLCGKTGYVVQSKNCAVSYGTSAAGTPYICVTAGSTSGWRCIYDHVEIYNRYVPESS
ncbi:MAG: serine hydrolase [Lachnospiraceae bacterium]|nr:serine hydrolase [Lachnospiraceae bacterium]